MSKTKKHAAPLLCRLEVWLRGPSPSCAVICSIGARGTRRRKCQGCKENIRGMICDGIDKAFERAATSVPALEKAVEAAICGAIPSSRGASDGGPGSAKPGRTYRKPPNNTNRRRSPRNE